MTSYADAYLICIESEITTTMIDKLAAIDPLPVKYVFRDSAFKDDIALKDETCDAEIRYLDELLQLKKKRGEEVIMSGLSLDIGSSCPEDESDIDDLADGNSSFVGDVDGEVPVRDTEEDEMITTGKIIPYI